MRKYSIVLIVFLLPYLGFAQKGNQPVINPIAPQAVQVKSAEGFIHPGIGLDVSDLNRIQKMVRQGIEPWASAFDEFRSDPKASKNYIIQNLDKNGNPKYEEMADGNGQYEARRDADAAYAQTIMWYITGDSDYSEKVINILRSWQTSTKRKNGDMLTAGMAMQKFCFAAEVLRYTPHSGWTAADTRKFEAFLDIMLPSTDRPTAFMNQGGIATMGLMSIAVFKNSRQLYAKAITRATVGTESLAPNRDYSLKNQIREVIDSASGKPVMVLVEMGRDQAHAQGDVGALGSLARTAYLQGTRVNSGGEIVEGTSSGSSLFNFMGHRLLTGASLVAKYNLGYDVLYPPTMVGTDAKPEIYKKESADVRGALAAVFELLYNHYRYRENIPDTDERLKYIKQVKDFKGIEAASQDFFGSGTLLYTDEKAIQNPGKPKAAPKAITLKDYASVAQKRGRIQAATYTGTKGDKTGNIGIEDYTDSEGTRSVISGIKINFYAWYKELDFGSTPLDKMLIRAASAASNGCKIDLILLDKVAGINLDSVTEANLSNGEVLAVLQIPATGSWGNYLVSKATLAKKLSGKHTIAMRYYGSGHVYRFQANVDWFKFTSTFDNEPDLVPVQQFEPVRASDISIVYRGKAVLGRKAASVTALKEGTTLVFPSIQFRNGPKNLALKVRSEGPASIELVNVSKWAQLTDIPFARITIPDTKGKWEIINADIASQRQITGSQMVFITVKGEGNTVDFEWMQFNPQK
ncbi:MAG: carbohydrate-binding protein [Sphingobacteriaceae bacterium]|nr:carbohydrate-binding protein [Sphingobacteriaceae bacterium]